MPRTQASDFTAALQLDTAAFLHLVELRLPAPVGTLRFALDAKDVTWNGNTFTAIGGWWGQFGQTTERQVTSLTLILTNADGVIGPKLDPKQGGVDGRGSKVVLRRTLRDFLTAGAPTQAVVEDTTYLEHYQWVDRQHLALGLATFPMQVIMVPWRTLQGLRCPFIYKGKHCGYVGDLKTCDRTTLGVNGCKAHFGEAPMRTGAFWSRGLDLRGA